MYANKPDVVLTTSVMAIIQKIAANNMGVFSIGGYFLITAHLDKHFLAYLRVLIFHLKYYQEYMCRLTQPEL